MLRTDVIYRVIDNPTTFEYAYSHDGISVTTYGSSKRARVMEGDLPIVPISREEFGILGTSTIHAHFNSSSMDCDGQIDRSYVVKARQGEDDLDFHDRIVSLVVSTYALMSQATLQVTRLGDDEVRLDWSEPTDEGYRSTEAVICNRDDCDENETTYRDHRAEEAGY